MCARVIAIPRVNLLNRLIVVLAWTVLAAAISVPPSHAQESSAPRFGSLRADRVNVRTGPGVRYPIAWVFVRRGLPVEVIAEYELWRKVRDAEGAEGWIHQSLLSGGRTVIVTGDVRALRRKPRADADVAAQVEPGVVADLGTCAGDWCEIRIASYEGWMPRAFLWGVGRAEKTDR
jgi:SH3-like domain-containing protein